MEIDFDNFKVLVIGDIMLDRYLTGDISRISPEAPVPVLDKVKIENKPGGAANVALNIKSLGAMPLLLSIAGDDKNGVELIRLLEKNGIATDNIITTKHKPTTVKTRIMSGGQHILRIDEEDNAPVNGDLISRIKSKFAGILENTKVDAIILQDYDKGMLTGNLIDFIISKAKEKGIFVSVDPKFNNFFSYKKVDLFKPNLKEISAALNRDVVPEIDSLIEESGYLHEKLGFKYIFITLGEKGIFYYGNGEAGIVPTTPIKVVDVSGAGDVVLSVSTLAFLQGYPVREIVKLANLAGGLACGIVGVATITKEQLQKIKNQKS